LLFRLQKKGTPNRPFLPQSQLSSAPRSFHYIFPWSRRICTDIQSQILHNFLLFFLNYPCVSCKFTVFILVLGM